MHCFLRQSRTLIDRYYRGSEIFCSFAGNGWVNRAVGGRRGRWDGKEKGIIRVGKYAAGCRLRGRTLSVVFWWTERGREYAGGGTLVPASCRKGQKPNTCQNRNLRGFPASRKDATHSHWLTVSVDLFTNLKKPLALQSVLLPSHEALNWLVFIRLDAIESRSRITKRNWRGFPRSRCSREGGKNLQWAHFRRAGLRMRGIHHRWLPCRVSSNGQYLGRPHMRSWIFVSQWFHWHIFLSMHWSAGLTCRKEGVNPGFHLPSYPSLRDDGSERPTVVQLDVSMMFHRTNSCHRPVLPVGSHHPLHQTWLVFLMVSYFVHDVTTHGQTG